MKYIKLYEDIDFDDIDYEEEPLETLYLYRYSFSSSYYLIQDYDKGILYKDENYGLSKNFNPLTKMDIVLVKKDIQKINIHIDKMDKDYNFFKDNFDNHEKNNVWFEVPYSYLVKNYDIVIVTEDSVNENIDINFDDIDYDVDDSYVDDINFLYYLRVMLGSSIITGQPFYEKIIKNHKEFYKKYSRHEMVYSYIDLLIKRVRRGDGLTDYEKDWLIDINNLIIRNKDTLSKGGDRKVFSIQDKGKFLINLIDMGYRKDFNKDNSLEYFNNYINGNIINEEIDINFDDIDEEEFDTVKDVYGDQINREDAVELYNGKWMHKDDAVYSDYHNYYIDPDDYNYVYTDDYNGDYIHSDYVKYSEYHDRYYHPDNEYVIWVNNNGYEDYIEDDYIRYVNGEPYHPDDDSIIYDDYNGDYIHETDAVYVNNRGENTHMDNAIWDDVDDEYIYREDHIELEDGRITKVDNTEETIDGKIHLIEDLEWSDKKGGYILKE